MSKKQLKIGDRVIVIGDTWKGRIGVISEEGGLECDWRVRINSTESYFKNGSLSFNENELATLDAASAAAAPAGEDAPRIDLNTFTLEQWPRMFHERATTEHWKDWYNEHGKNDMLDALDVIATLQAANRAQAEEIARLRAALATVEKHLSAIQDYVFAPDAVHAELFTTEEKIHGMVSQAMSGLDVITEILETPAADSEGA